jgi:hypothetical protein
VGRTKQLMHLQSEQPLYKHSITETEDRYNKCVRTAGKFKPKTILTAPQEGNPLPSVLTASQEGDLLPSVLTASSQRTRLTMRLQTSLPRYKTIDSKDGSCGVAERARAGPGLARSKH